MVNSALSRITVLSGLTVNSVKEFQQRRVEVEYQNERGTKGRLTANRVVLAAGTLGNTRVLSNSEISQDLPALGGGFMDHVSTRVAQFEVTDWDRFRSFAAPKRIEGVLASPRMVPEVEFLKERELLPAYAHWEFESAPGGAVASLRSYLEARQTGARRPPVGQIIGNIVSDAGALVEAAGRSLRFAERPVVKNCRPYLRVDVQQPTRPDVTIKWLPRAKEPALPNLSIDWRTGSEENHAAKVIADALLPALSELQIGATPRRLPCGQAFDDIFHMMGGTRMADSANEGVVDGSLRVFGTSNIFVAGASVFPSGGMANPTYTALALAARLGDHIAQ